MDMIRLDQIPASPGAKKGRWAYVTGHPAPIWVKDKFDWWQLVTKVGAVGGLIALALKIGEVLGLTF